jgi:hypothetical protein
MQLSISTVLIIDNLASCDTPVSSSNLENVNTIDQSVQCVQQNADNEIQTKRFFDLIQYFSEFPQNILVSSTHFNIYAELYFFGYILKNFLIVISKISRI